VQDTRYTMVTLPTEAATNYGLVKSLMRSGMNIARINTSHDNHDIWLKMVENIRAGAKSLGRSCKIYFDLAGPKIRVCKMRNNSGRKTNVLQIHKHDLICLHTPEIGKKQIPIGCKSIMMEWPEIIEVLAPHQEIWYDDGKIGTMIIDVQEHYVLAKVTHTSKKGKKLKLEKGINFPDARLKIPALTEDDRMRLPFIAQYADMVGYSFVKTPEDISQLQDELRKLGREDMGLILKIETASAFDNLPELLLTSMRNPVIGVMVARGDLAVEIGFERISEVQEELLWICEAAHVPIIWATQVLENLAKTGTATRAEITDAAMSVRAECVMLNKGPHIIDAVQSLRNIMARMDNHFLKRKGMLRALSIAKHYFAVN
ncbi:MAG: pyruvate kinase, partial [Saprospiraceae bacterium]|nr:pyruvate kinase [Saprospiraceae bacterium]